MPVAMAALDVAGQIRERSPADVAIFGEGAGRLIERFVQRDRGQALLARAVSDGSAEGIGWLATAAGQERFRISLWRQRGGERVRVLAAFSACEEKQVEATAHVPDGTRQVLLRLGLDMHMPLNAVIGFAEMIREKAVKLKAAEMAGHASDIVAAACRLMRVAEDLEAAGTSGEPHLAAAPSEVDIARLARRVARLAAPAAGDAGVTIDIAGLPERGRGPLVLCDERTLWSVLDGLVENAVRRAGHGAAVRFALQAAGSHQGIVLEISDDGPGLEADELARLLEGGGSERGIALGRTMAKANGAELEFETAPGQGLTARLVFPAARCLDPV